jgi:Predicted membrane protein
VIVQDKTNKLTRFHAFQSILLTVVAFVLYFVAMIITVAGAAANSSIISLLGTLIYLVIALGLLVAVILCAIKAFQGQIFKLPVVGDMADKWSN